jgi:hypothetical protein
MSKKDNQLNVIDLRGIKKLETMIFSNPLCVFLHSNNCGPCKLFSKVWERVVHSFSNDNNVTFLKIEVGMISQIKEHAPQFHNKVLKKMILSYGYVPNIAKYNPLTKRVSILKNKTEDTLHSFIKNI